MLEANNSAADDNARAVAHAKLDTDGPADGRANADAIRWADDAGDASADI